MAQPDLALIDDGFARRFATSPHPNLQVELLRRLLASEVRSVARHNVVAERKFSEMLERAMRAYTNRSLTAAEVIAELVELAKALRAEQNRGATLGLRDDELAFYDAVHQNDSAVLKLGDEVLKRIAQELVEVVRANTSVDWDKKEQVRALLRSKIRRLLTKYHYPPDKQEAAVALVIEQAEVLAGEQVA
jgi:type I restriction enzyme R subunit